MKLVLTIISNKDCPKVVENLVKEGFFATKIATQGQFLVDGNTTILTVCENEKVEKIYDIIKNNVTKRTIRTVGVTSTLEGSLLNKAVDVEENGAVAFSVDVDNFQKF